MHSNDVLKLWKMLNSTPPNRPTISIGMVAAVPIRLA